MLVFQSTLQVHPHHRQHHRPERRHDADGKEDVPGEVSHDFDLSAHLTQALPFESLVRTANIGHRRRPGRSSSFGHSTQVPQLFILIGGGIGFVVLNIGPSHQRYPSFEGLRSTERIGPVAFFGFFFRASGVFVGCLRNGLAVFVAR